RVPLAEDRARLDLGVFLDQQVRAGWNFVLLQLAPLGIEDQDFAVAGEHDLFARVVLHDLQAGVLDDTALLGANFAFLDRAGRGATDVEGTHGELRTRLANALGGDDAHGHALFDHRTGREVHAVATPADTQRCVTGHRAANLDLLQAELFDPAG